MRPVELAFGHFKARNEQTIHNNPVFFDLKLPQDGDDQSSVCQATVFGLVSISTA
jgi:hypothetical protein